MAHYTHDMRYNPGCDWVQCQNCRMYVAREDQVSEFRKVHLNQVCKHSIAGGFRIQLLRKQL
jgi:hypothetical protein